MKKIIFILLIVFLLLSFTKVDAENNCKVIGKTKYSQFGYIGPNGDFYSEEHIDGKQVFKKNGIEYTEGFKKSKGDMFLSDGKTYYNGENEILFLEDGTSKKLKNVIAFAPTGNNYVYLENKENHGKEDNYLIMENYKTGKVSFKYYFKKGTYLIYGDTNEGYKYFLKKDYGRYGYNNHKTNGLFFSENGLHVGFIEYSKSNNTFIYDGKKDILNNKGKININKIIISNNGSSYMYSYNEKFNNKSIGYLIKDGKKISNTNKGDSFRYFGYSISSKNYFYIKNDIDHNKRVYINGKELNQFIFSSFQKGLSSYYSKNNNFNIRNNIFSHGSEDYAFKAKGNDSYSYSFIVKNGKRYTSDKIYVSGFLMDGNGHIAYQSSDKYYPYNLYLSYNLKNNITSSNKLSGVRDYWFDSDNNLHYYYLYLDGEKSIKYFINNKEIFYTKKSHKGDAYWTVNYSANGKNITTIMFSFGKDGKTLKNNYINNKKYLDFELNDNFEDYFIYNIDGTESNYDYFNKNKSYYWRKIGDFNIYYACEYVVDNKKIDTEVNKKNKKQKLYKKIDEIIYINFEKQLDLLSEKNNKEGFEKLYNKINRIVQYLNKKINSNKINNKNKDIYIYLRDSLKDISEKDKYKYKVFVSENKNKNLNKKGVDIEFNLTNELKLLELNIEKLNKNDYLIGNECMYIDDYEDRVQHFENIYKFYISSDKKIKKINGLYDDLNFLLNAFTEGFGAETIDYMIDNSKSLSTEDKDSLKKIKIFFSTTKNIFKNIKNVRNMTYKKIDDINKLYDIGKSTQEIINEYNNYKNEFKKISYKNKKYIIIKNTKISGLIINNSIEIETILGDDPMCSRFYEKLDGGDKKYNKAFLKAIFDIRIIDKKNKYSKEEIGKYFYYLIEYYYYLDNNEDNELGLDYILIN